MKKLYYEKPELLVYADLRDITGNNGNATGNPGNGNNGNGPNPSRGNASNP